MSEKLFALYSPGQRHYYLLQTGLVALLTPFCDTIYLPALSSVKEDLRADDVQVSVTVSAYLAAVALGQLTFGPLADYFGRKNVILYGLLAFEGFTIACIYSPTIETLIALRAMQGFLCAASLISAQAVVADIYAPAERGAASGLFFTPLLIGPILAPLFGGYLSSAFGWRSTFVLLAAMTVPIALIVWACLPETHPFYVIRQLGVELKDTLRDFEGLHASESSSADEGGETWVEALAVQLPEDLQGEAGADSKRPSSSSSSSTALKQLVYAAHRNEALPPLVMPWEALRFLVDSQLLPYYLNVCLSFAAMFTSLAIVPLYFALPPWNLSPGEVGLTYLPSGVAMLLGSVFGGKVSDLSAKQYPHSADGRITLMLYPLWVIPFGAVAFAYTLQYRANLAAVLVTQCVFVGAQASMMPATMSYLSTVRPASAGAVASITLFLCFAASAVSISLCVIISDAIGLLSALNLGAIIYTTVCNLHRIRIKTPPVDGEDALGNKTKTTMT